MDFVVGESIAIVVLDTITDGSKRWLYREFGFIGQQYESVVVIGNHIPDEHQDVWRSLGRRMENRSTSTFRFIGFEQQWQSRTASGSSLRPLVAALGFGAVAIGWLSFGTSFYAAVASADQLAGAFAGGVALFLALVLLYCAFFLRYF